MADGGSVHVADAGGVHVADGGGVHVADGGSVYVAELEWAREQLSRMPWHDALWAHRRALIGMCAGCHVDGDACSRADGARPGAALFAALRRELEVLAMVSAGCGSACAYGGAEQIAAGVRAVEQHREWCRRRLSDADRT